jgi:hypothetical protein
VSAAHPRDLDRLFDLMADFATEGLIGAGRDEFEILSKRHPDVDPLALDMTAAALDLFLSVEPTEPLPAHLRQRLEADASAFFAGSGARGVPGSARRDRSPGGGRAPRAPRSREPWWTPATVSGWVAAAAAVVWILLGGGGAFESHGAGGTGPVARIDAAVRRASLVEEVPDAVTLEWTATDDAAAAGASGDLVWSPALQEGFMRFRGLAPNDPSVQQYQLWIFDAARGEQYPVDGGVFDIAPGRDEVVVPIRPQLPISQAVLFAVTIEQPGGVVVSSRDRLPLLAKASR